MSITAPVSRKKPLRVSHLAHFYRSFSHIGICFMLSLLVHFADFIPTCFFHSFTPKMQELLECIKDCTGLLLKKALCSLIWLQGPACDRVLGGSWGLGCPIPADSTLLLTACAVCTGEGYAIALKCQGEVPLVAGPDSVKRKKQTLKNRMIRKVIKVQEWEIKLMGE